MTSGNGARVLPSGNVMTYNCEWPIGEDAFEAGLIVGSDDYWLCERPCRGTRTALFKFPEAARSQSAFAGGNTIH